MDEADGCISQIQMEQLDLKGFNTRMTINALHLAIFSKQIDSLKCLLEHIFEGGLENGKQPVDMMKDLPNYLFWQHFPEPRSHFSGNYTPAAKRSPAFINFNNSKFFILDKSYKYFQRQAPKMPERCLIFHTLSIVESGFYFTEDLDMWTVCVQGGPSLEPSKYN